MENVKYDEAKAIALLQDYYAKKKLNMFWDSIFAQAHDVYDSAIRTGFNEEFALQVAFGVVNKMIDKAMSD